MHSQRATAFSIPGLGLQFRNWVPCKRFQMVEPGASMRVIAGLAKGRRLRSVPGSTTRPITDRAKEALFGKLHGWLPQRTVLDLFGGTGAVGLEALSRGAAKATFVESNARAISTMRLNGQHCGLFAKMELIKGDSFRYLTQPDIGPFDFIFIAPPQFKGMWIQALMAVEERPELLTTDGIVVVQVDPKEQRDLALQHIICFDNRKYGNVLLCYYKLRPPPDLASSSFK